MPCPDPLRLLLYAAPSRLEPGGVQAVFARLAASLAARGHAVAETWSGPGPAAPGPSEWICPLDFQVRPPLTLPLRGTASLVRLARGLAVRRPAVVNLHYVRGEALYFLLLRRWFGYRLVLSLHGSDLLRPSPAARRLLPWLLPRADAVTVVAGYLREAVAQIPGMDPSRIHVIPNGIDHAFWSGARPTASDETPLIIAVGRLEPVKGLDVLLEALGRLRRRHAGARLVVVGGGAERPALEAEARRLGVAEAVTFTGHLGREAVRDLLGQASVYALPSRSEGMPLALLEGMAAGLPAVATAVGGVPEVLTPDCGRMVPPDDAEALAEALAAVLDHPDRAAMGEAARRRAAGFSATAGDAAYEALFRSLVETAPITSPRTASTCR